MRRIALTRVFLSLGLTLGALAPALPLAAADRHPVEIKEWNIPWQDSQPRGGAGVRPDLVWFAGQTGNYLARLNPQTGIFSRVDLIDEPGPGGLIVAANGMVWYAASSRGYIGRYDPHSRTVRHIAMPNAAASDPRRLAFDHSQKTVWFTVPTGNIVGRVDIDSAVVDLVGVPTANALPDRIVVAADGSPWVALSGTNKLATLDPKTLAMTEHALPRANARPHGLGFTSDGRLWYVDFAEGYLGVLAPDGEVTKEWRVPGGKGSHPDALAVDSKDRLWIVETGSEPNRLAGFDPGTGRFFSVTRVPSSMPQGVGTVHDMTYDTGSGQLWFVTDASTIGYAKVN